MNDDCTDDCIDDCFDCIDCIECANCGEHVTHGFPTYGTNRDICAECWF